MKIFFVIRISGSKTFLFFNFFALLLFLFLCQILPLAVLIYLLLFLSHYHFAKGRKHILHFKVLDNII